LPKPVDDGVIRVIYRRAALREMTVTAGAVFVALFSIMLATQLIRLLRQAAEGRLIPDALVALLGFGALAYLPVLLTLTLFIAVLMTFSRWYRDSEMSIWLASGLSLTRWIGVAFRFAWPLLILIGVFSLWLAPWAASRSETYRKTLEQREDIERVQAGAFNESGSGDRVFFVESIDPDAGKVGNVFVSSERDGVVTVIATATGHIETAPNADRFLVLENGRRYDTQSGTPSFRVMEFERYGVRIDTGGPLVAPSAARSLSTAALVADNSPPAQAELLWRIATPVSAAILIVLALPLAFTNPRAGGRALNLMAAILLYLIYNNLLNVMQVWVAQGKVAFGIGVWAVHAGMVGVIVVLMLFRRRPISWRRLIWR
jgi:lipopolysaccharide export system permease protein